MEIEIEKGDWERIRDQSKNLIREHEINLMINRKVYEYALNMIDSMEKQDGSKSP